MRGFAVSKANSTSTLAPVLDDEPSEREIAVPPSPPETAGGVRSRPLWRHPAILALAILALAVVIGLWAFGGSEAPPPRTGAAVPVRAEAAAVGSLAIRSSYSGELVGEVADVAPQVGGLLDDVQVRVGDHVRKGDMVARIDDVDLRNQYLEAKAQLAVAEANARRAEAELQGSSAEYRRSHELYGEQLISDQEFERVAAQHATLEAGVAAAQAQIEQARARYALLEEQVAYTRVTAPFDGKVAARYLDRGALVQPGKPILRVVEDGPLLVQFRVPERDLGAVRPGATISITTQVTGAETFAGRVLRVSGEVSRADRAVLVEAELSREDELLLPGMYADVLVRLRQIDDEVVVPGAAVLERVGMDGRSATGVFVAHDDKAAWVPVEILGRAEGRAAVKGALSAGDLVLTLGHTELEDGSTIRVVQVAGEGVPAQETGS